MISTSQMCLCSCCLPDIRALLTRTKISNDTVMQVRCRGLSTETQPIQSVRTSACVYVWVERCVGELSVRARSSILIVVFRMCVCVGVRVCVCVYSMSLAIVAAPNNTAWQVWVCSMFGTNRCVSHVCMCVCELVCVCVCA